MSTKLELLKEIVLSIPDKGVRGAAQAVFKKFLISKALKLGRLFAFGPVNWLVGLGIDWVLNQLLDFLEQWVKDNIYMVMVKRDFNKLQDALIIGKEKELEKNVTKEELDAVDQNIRDAVSNAIRLGRLRK